MHLITPTDIKGCHPGQSVTLDGGRLRRFRPADGEWLYFVGRGDGTSQFSKTLNEHNRAVRKYQLGIETDEDRR